MKIDFQKGSGLVPAIVQDSQTGKVLMLGYMNEEAYQQTCSEKKVTFFSRSKQRLWTKGETSGNFLFVNQILVDCDNDTLLIKATPEGPVCHTGQDTCFGEKNEKEEDFILYLSKLIKGRKVEPREGSYTSSLFEKGKARIAQKVGEEAVELVIEALKDDDQLFLEEAADLLFHLLVLLEENGKSFDDIIEVLKGRHKNG